MKRFLLGVMLLMPTAAVWANDDLSGLLQMLDYVGVDYRGAVHEGQIANPAEYEEMKGFVGGIEDRINALPQGTIKSQLQQQARDLRELVQRKGASENVATQVAGMRTQIIRHFKVSAVPRVQPDLGAAKRLFAINCAACHGAKGRGNGPNAARLDPVPTNFRDPQRHDQRSVYGLYNTITLGVPGTSMPAFNELSDHQRWSLAFYVGQLGASASRITRGKALWQAKADQAARPPVATLEHVTTMSPADAERTYGTDGTDLLTYLRENPAELYRTTAMPLDVASTKLDESVVAYRQGETEVAYQRAVTAYLEGFELVEAGLNASAPKLRERIEHQMTDFRRLIQATAPVARIEREAAEIKVGLDSARSHLDTATLSSGTAFAGAFVILLREGLEALLVIAAFMAFLGKTGRRDAMPYLHIGWVGALVAGAATWYVSSYIVEIGGESREMTEGVAALVAAAVLFGVGFWLHDKAHAAQWKRFIDEQMNKALGSATLWSLAMLSFVVVYREVFETVLFYQALWIQTPAGGRGMVLAGLAAAAGGLTVLAWLILRYSQRLPLRQFFGATGVLLLVLAVVFAGKGIAAFQEAGKLPSSPVDFPTIEILGIYPNIQGLFIQFAMVAVAVALAWYSNRRATTNQLLK